MSQPLPPFDDVSWELADRDVNLHPSECHGSICGYVCGISSADYTDWMTQVLLEIDKRDALEEPVNLDLDQKSYDLPGLMTVFRVTAAQLSDPGFEFSLLLPSDEVGLEERTEALAAWCQGFLFGLTACGIRKFESLSEDVNEVIRDIVEISKAGLNEGVTEEDEAAFEEVVEYVRMGVLLIWTEIRQRGVKDVIVVH